MSDQNSFIHSNEESQYLLFKVGGDLYAIEALKTSEIVEYSQITKVPMMHSFVKGVTNIRGNIVPVIDLLDRFGLEVTKIQPKTSIVVINHTYDSTVIQIGVIIDEVYEVDDIPADEIKPPPDFGTKIKKEFIKSEGKYSGDYIAILNTETILNIHELSQIE